MDNIVNNFNADSSYTVVPHEVVSHVRLLDDVGDNYACSYTIEENGHLCCTIICTTQAPQDIQLSFFLKRNASLRLELLFAHVSSSVSLVCCLDGELSHAVINGAYVLGGTNTLSINTEQCHIAANTTSKLVMKGVLNDYAQSKYFGKIFVPKNAHSTVASQENKNIVLSDNARALSVPQLEVLTNDVHCFHGSAIGGFEAEQLFYATSRGIELKKAEQLLLKGFFSDLFENDVAKKSLENYL